MFTEHAKDKLIREIRKLGITEQAVIAIVKNPDELLYDALTGRFVALSWSHSSAVIYEKTDGDLLVVTVIYSSELREVVDRRRRIGRWI
ncbi:MAG: hypothetical protein AOA65_0473 [Candidatus Bathyarchaeota archaeon BA1]|nr:MAG: hypothetical protein AOA65_0473 [Candidatus Bathyarchaeota archaeon BA1]